MHVIPIPDANRRERSRFRFVYLFAYLFQGVGALPDSRAIKSRGRTREKPRPRGRHGTSNFITLTTSPSNVLEYSERGIKAAKEGNATLAPITEFVVREHQRLRNASTQPAYDGHAPNTRWAQSSPHCSSYRSNASKRLYLVKGHTFSENGQNPE